MPKYKFRANMCMTFIVECEKNTLIADIKILFAQELKISTNDITMTRMPFKQVLNDGDKIGDFPPVERSFIFIKFNAPYKLPDLSQNKMLSLINPEMHEVNHNLPFEYEENDTPITYDINEYTIFSDNYQLHLTREPKYNFTNDFLLENISKTFEYSYNYNDQAEQTSSNFISKLIETYQKNNINDLEQLLSDELSDIDYEINDSKFPHEHFEICSEEQIPDLKTKLDSKSSYYDEIIKFVQKDSPEAADFMKSHKYSILKKITH